MPRVLDGVTYYRFAPALVIDPDSGDTVKDTDAVAVYADSSDDSPLALRDLNGNETVLRTNAFGVTPEVLVPQISPPEVDFGAGVRLPLLPLEYGDLAQAAQDAAAAAAAALAAAQALVPYTVVAGDGVTVDVDDTARTITVSASTTEVDTVYVDTAGFTAANNSAALQPVPGLSYHLTPDPDSTTGRFEIEVRLAYTGDPTADLKIAVALPSGATALGEWLGNGLGVSNEAGTSSRPVMVGSNPQSYGALAGNPLWATLLATVDVPAAGDITVQVAQSTATTVSSADRPKILGLSSMTVTRTS